MKGPILLVGLVSCLISPGARSAAGEEAPTVAKAACRLAPGHEGVVEEETLPEACGSGGCGQRSTIRVRDREGRALLTLTTDHGAFASPVAAEVRCARGLVGVRVAGEAPPIEIPLRFDPATGRLRLAGGWPEADGWRRAPLVGGAAARREKRAHLLDVVLAGGEAEARGEAAPVRPEDSWVFNVVDGLDQEMGGALWALVARDQGAAGDWAGAKERLDRLASSGTPERPLAPAVVRRIAQVRRALAAEARRTAPLRVAERRRIGTTLAPQRLPVDPGVPATMYWRGGELCVLQEEEPPRTMRCHAAEARRWGGAVPIEPPAADARGLKVVVVDGRSAEECVGTREARAVVPIGVPDAEVDVCEDDRGVLLDAIAAVVEGGALLVPAGAGTFSLAAGLAPARKIDAEAARALIARSAGSLLVGGGCCRFGRDQLLRRLDGGGGKTWDLLGAPPRGETWVEGPPLASPDGRFAVAQSARRGRVSLWLYRLEPTGAPAR
jgi:hypothetical protein